MTRPTVNVRRLFAVLWPRRWFLAACFVAAGVGSAMYALTREEQFQSDAVLAQAREESGSLSGALGGLLGQVAGMAGGLLQGQGTSIDESVEVLTSRDFSLRFMREHGVLQYLFPRQWNPVAQTWKAAPGPSMWSSWAGDKPRERPAGPSPDDAVKAFNEIRLVVVDRRTNFIKLSVRGPTPQTAQAWATAMIDELNDQLRQRVLADSRRAVELLSKRADSEQVQSVRTAAAALLELQLRKEVAAESRREFAVRTLDPPSRPDQRYSPRRTRIVMVGSALGFALGAALVLAHAAWRQRRAYAVRRAAEQGSTA
jgi:uncharacterized protein involved in exopolysaccharide biosynthesis